MPGVLIFCIFRGVDKKYYVHVAFIEVFNIFLTLMFLNLLYFQGLDEAYDVALIDFFNIYHTFVVFSGCR